MRFGGRRTHLNHPSFTTTHTLPTAHLLDLPPHSCLPIQQTLLFRRKARSRSINWFGRPIRAKDRSTAHLHFLGPLAQTSTARSFVYHLKGGSSRLPACIRPTSDD